MSIKDDYWRYYVEVPYKSPVSKTYKDENGVEHTEYKWLTYDEGRKLLKWDSNKVAMYEIKCILENRE